PTDLTRGIFGADSGELITASITNGIPHPSGYPTWLIASRLFARLPIGRTLAHRYNLFSVLCMSLAMLTLAIACRLQLPKKQSGSSVVSLAAVLTISFTLTVWSQAIITEVYALNSLMVTLVIVLLAKADKFAMSSGLALILGLTCGIAMTTHLTSILLLPAVGLLVLSQARSLLKVVPIFTSGFALGLLPFLLLFWRSGSHSPVIWGDTSSVSGWWWLVSGSIYRPNLFAVPAADMLSRVQIALLANPLNILFLLIPLGALIGVFCIYVGNDKSRPVSILPAALLLTAALYTLYALSYNTQDWRVFLLPANLCLALPLAMGLNSLRLKQWSLVLPLLLIALNLPVLLNSKTDMTRAEASMVFEQAPAEAILLTDGRDETVFPIWYFRYAENQRPDIVVVDQNLFAFDWYRSRLATQHPSLQAIEVDNLTEFRRQNRQSRPVCEVSLHPFALNCTDR
ncbi:MAG: hypothetical protein ACI9EW_003444, partial [Cellvibrionaceae bacterium]